MYTKQKYKLADKFSDKVPKSEVYTNSDGQFGQVTKNNKQDRTDAVLPVVPN